MYKILIRPLEQNDSEISWKWRNDEEVWKYTGSRPNISVTPEIERDWINKVLNQTNSRRFAITVDDKYVGNIQLTNITSENAEYHIFIGDKDYWGKGIGFSATQQIIRFAKNVLKLKQVYLYVQKDNENAVKLYQRCGFVQVSNDIKMILDLNYTNPPQVSVFCMVYNHEPFLEQCLEGFLMQKCLFDFEIVIGEDCSKDKSREILLKYQSKFPGKFKLLLHNQNVGAVNNQNIVLSNCTGKYIALCEGDDYWTDPLKLQKQVDFLEENEDYSVCGTYCDVLRDQIYEKRQFDKKITFSFFDVIVKNPIPTLTVCFRGNVIKNFENFLNYTIGDIPLLLALTENGHKGCKLPLNTAVYRYHGHGANSGNSRKKNIKLQIQTKYKYIFGLSNYKIYLFFIKTLFFQLLNEVKNIILLRVKLKDIPIVFYYVKYIFLTYKLVTKLK